MSARCTAPECDQQKRGEQLRSCPGEGCEHRVCSFHFGEPVQLCSLCIIAESRARSAAAFKPKIRLIGVARKRAQDVNNGQRRARRAVEREAAQAGATVASPAT